ncbi:MAG: hypothetical protein OEQ75_13670 [Gemmatimonadota bacterium]|nr:hypothetical protein [Gemmatimonadota bacterium]
MTTSRDEAVLRRLFLGHQTQLMAKLEGARGAIDHPVLKGTASEQHWRDLLSDYLPQRYRVTSGVVVDCKSGQSGQIDIIIHDAHFCPRFLDQEGVCLVPAESVYAVFETKQEVNGEYLAEAADKAESVRRLLRTSATIIDRGEERPARPLTPILAGVVALGAVWVDGLGESFREHLARHRGMRSLDLGCAVSAGAFEVPEGAGADRAQISTADVALVTFLLTLVRRLQRLGTVPAIDWPEYEIVFGD